MRVPPWILASCAALLALAAGVAAANWLDGDLPLGPLREIERPDH